MEAGKLQKQFEESLLRGLDLELTGVHTTDGHVQVKPSWFRNILKERANNLATGFAQFVVDPEAPCQTCKREITGTTYAVNEFGPHHLKCLVPHGT